MTEYVRGTLTTRTNTARLRAGDQVLTIAQFGRPDLWPATRKTGSIIRTVASTEQGAQGRGYRSPRLYRVEFTDGTAAQNLAPIQTWHRVVVTPTVEPTS